MPEPSLTENFLRGDSVRLGTLSPDEIDTIMRWWQDVGFLRLHDARPAYPGSAQELRKWIEEASKSPNGYLFAIRLIEGDQLIGFIELDGILWAHGVAWLGLAIGERAEWGKGYGEEAMRLALGFAFRELNLHRVQLTVFDYNERARRLYEKLGFRHEGAYREFMQRDGQRYDMHLYGLLRREWEAERAS